jgi:hypothetical protein
LKLCFLKGQGGQNKRRALHVRRLFCMITARNALKSFYTADGKLQNSEEFFS